MHPLRLSLCTCNLWNTERWPDREPALRLFLQRFRPDILCVQELRPETRDCIDQVCNGHARIEDPLPGWSGESNIWWRTDLFTRVAHDAEDIGIDEPDRRLFWVRLRRPDTDETILVATVHLTHQHTARESTTGQSPRIAQARRAAETLDRVVGDQEPAWLMGDFNDAVHVTAILSEAGFTSCFSDFGVQPPVTFPAWPTSGVRAGDCGTSVTFDWITANRHARAICADSPRLFAGDLAPSDHWPVLAVYEVSRG